VTRASAEELIVRFAAPDEPRPEMWARFVLVAETEDGLVATTRKVHEVDPLHGQRVRINRPDDQ
jgi:hypothetical protein